MAPRPLGPAFPLSFLWAYPSVLAAAVFPAACPGCGARAEPVCDECAASRAPAARAAPPPGVDRVAAAFVYRGVARELVARVKYRNARAAVPFLARAMARAAGDLAVPGGAVVTWAPTTPRRRAARGFDHAGLLARAVARELDLPAAASLVRHPGPPQTGCTPAERRAGPRFSARGAAPVAGRVVVVVDDVVTTGATLAAAARALRAGGAAGVLGLAAARTDPPAARAGRRTDRRTTGAASVA